MDKDTRFESMMEEHGDGLSKYAHQLIDNPADAQDVLQETKLRAWRFFDKLEDPLKARAWLGVILRRQSAQRFENKQYIHVTIDDEEVTHSPIKLDKPSDSDLIDLEKMINGLSPAYAEALRLRVCGYSYAETAKISGTTIKSTRRYIHRATQQLRLQCSQER